MNTNEKLSFFLDLLQCGGPIFYWSYDHKGNLIASASAWETLHMFFERSGCLRHALAWTGTTPLCLGSPFGTLWGVVFTGEGEERTLHVIGPVQNTELSEKALDDVARNYINTHKLRKFFLKMVDEVPIVPLNLFQHYILMLHLTLTGETLGTADVSYQTESGNIERRLVPAESRRHYGYRAEKQLLYHIKNGDPNYKKAKEYAASVDAGLRVRTKDPLLQALLTATSFTSLCTRAAIEGGLPTDAAFTIGDGYIQSIIECRNVSEVTAIGIAMYDDFVQRTSKLHRDEKLSPQILTCCEYIRMHPEEELSIASLAKLTGYTDYYLSRKFKSEVGQSLRSYIDAARIERAKMLLTTTDTPVAEIAQMLRYCSSSHFGDVFKRLTGKLPGEYRREHS